jgi:hypothetical protein
MVEQNKENNKKEKKEKKAKKANTLNEAGAVCVEGHIKIFDPNTEEVFVNKRS